MPNANATVEAKVLIANKEITWPLMKIELEQEAFAHHEAKVTVALDIADQVEKKRFVTLDDFQSTLGKSLTIKIKPADEYVAAGEELEFVGIIYNVTFENDVERINVVTFHVLSPTKFMDHEKINHVWHDSKLDAAVKSIIGKYSQVEQGEIKFPSDDEHYLVQFRETDWAFLCRLAARESIWLYYDGRKLVANTAKSSNTHTLDWEKHVGSFDLKMKIDHLENHSEVYFEGQKQQLYSDSTKGSGSTDFSKLTKTAHKISKSTFKGKSAQVYPPHAKSLTEVTKSMVNRRQAQIGGLVAAEVESNVPAIKIGDTIKITGMADFCGTYYVKKVTHTLEAGAYHNEVEALPLETAHPDWHAPTTKMPDYQPAEVIDNKDPEKRYRVKVRLNYTDENDQRLETPWIRVLTDHSGGDHGHYFLPEIGDEVLVGFQREDPEMPVVLGTFWNGTDKPADDYPNNDNNYKAIYTKGGNKIEIGDEGGKEYIKFTNNAKNFMYFECDGPKITMHTDGDINIDATKNISIKAGGDYSLEATNITVKATGDIKETADGNIKVEAMGNIDEKATGNISQSATGNWESKATGTWTGEGTGSATLKSSAATKVSGGISVEIQGAMVRIN